VGGPNGNTFVLLWGECPMFPKILGWANQSGCGVLFIYFGGAFGKKMYFFFWGHFVLSWNCFSDISSSVLINI